MTIDFYAMPLSPACRAVEMTARQLNIDLNVKLTDLTKGEHLNDDYLKINPANKIPSIIDDGFVLTESRAIMQYLCNQYAPDSTLYPKEPKQRALVDRWLNFDMTFFNHVREGFILPLITGAEPTEPAIKSLKDTLKLMDQLIANNQYLTSNQLTIADLSVLANSAGFFMLDWDLSAYPHFKSWAIGLHSELPYYEEINKFSKDQIFEYANKMKAFFVKQMQK